MEKEVVVSMLLLSVVILVELLSSLKALLESMVQHIHPLARLEKFILLYFNLILQKPISKNKEFFLLLL